MAWIKSVLAKIVFNKLTKEATENMKGLIDKLNGYKTYITALIGVLIAFLGAAWGPINVGPIDIPSMNWDAFWKVVWEALMLIFLRKGVATTATTK